MATPPDLAAASITIMLLTVTDSTIMGNQGGGIYNDAENSGDALLEINNSSVTVTPEEAFITMRSATALRR
jgi:hypothetical protein